MKARMLLLSFLAALSVQAGPAPAADLAAPSALPVMPALGWRSLVTALHRSDRSMGPDPWTVIEPLLGPRKAFGLPPVRQTGPEQPPSPVEPNGPLHRRVRDTGPDGPPLG